jgi:arylsulfatase A
MNITGEMDIISIEIVRCEMSKQKSQRNYFILFICSMIFLLPLNTSPQSPPARPNIILIMADDLGYEGLGCNGSQSYVTPNLDHLAQTGMRFEHCYSQPICTPSRVQIMTGRYNFRNYKMFGYLELEEITFGHILRYAGYKTCIVGKWQLSNGIEGPYHAGFDEYCLWQIYRNIAGKGVRGSRYADPKIYQNGKVLQNLAGKYGPDVFCDFILNFIERNQGQRFFVYYPMVLTHDPFVPTPDSEDWMHDRNKHDVRYFADMILYMDKIVGKIVEKLDSLNLRENTIILFTADNGSHRKIRSKINGKWIQGGKSLMTDAGTHVPLIANWPGTIKSGEVSDALIDFSDFLPTLSDLGGTVLPQEVTIDGKSFYQVLCGERKTTRDWIFMHYWERGRNILNTRRCIRDRRYKLYDDGHFYDILNDPMEENPILDLQLSKNKELSRIKNSLQKVLHKLK